jgi:hypothetical protein
MLQRRLVCRRNFGYTLLKQTEELKMFVVSTI